MQIDKKYAEWAASGLLFVVVFWFWFIPHRYFLNYHEQLQLFLFSTDYLLERISLPGGFIDYVSEFLVQLFYIPALGAAILALLFLGLQRLSWMLCRNYGSDSCYYPLSFIPVFALWLMMSNENVLLTFPLSITAALILSHLYFKFENSSAKYIFLFFALTAGYWLIGPSVFILSLNSVVKERKRPWIVLMTVALSLIPPLISGLILPFELSRFFFGINYYRYPTYNPTVQNIVTILFAGIPLVAGIISKYPGRRRRGLITAILMSVVLLVGESALLSKIFNSPKNKLLEFDYLVRLEQWNDLIKKAKEQQPYNPFGVCCVNLALSQKGQLPDRLFEFYQNGGTGLIPPFKGEMTYLIPPAETFYRLGMVNTAHRFFYGAQESIPNHRSSGRFMKRLVECEIVNRQYPVARKWLNLLKKSLFYRAWAKEMLTMLEGGDNAVESNPTFSVLRRKRPSNDYLFNYSDMDLMLGALFTEDNSNLMAYEYLMCYLLLEKDLDTFMNYLPLSELAGYDHIPTAFQEVLVGILIGRNQDPNTLPYKIDSGILDNTIQYIRLFMKNRNNPALDSPPYNTNAWNYFLRGGVFHKEAKEYGQNLIKK